MLLAQSLYFQNINLFVDYNCMPLKLFLTKDSHIIAFMTLKLLKNELTSSNDEFVTLTLLLLF